MKLTSLPFPFANLPLPGTLIACAFFLSAVPPLRAESTDPMAPTDPLGVAELSNEQGWEEKGPDRDVARAVKELQKRLGGPLAERSDLLKPYPKGQPFSTPTAMPDGTRSARPGRQAPRPPAPGGTWPGFRGPQPFPQEQPRLAAPPRLAPQPVVPGPGGPEGHHFRSILRPGPGAGKPVALLRMTASELDRAANRLEWDNLYPQADSLRKLAQELRLEARKRQKSKSPQAPDS